MSFYHGLGMFFYNLGAVIIIALIVYYFIDKYFNVRPDIDVHEAWDQFMRNSWNDTRIIPRHRVTRKDKSWGKGIIYRKAVLLDSESFAETHDYVIATKKIGDQTVGNITKPVFETKLFKLCGTLVPHLPIPVASARVLNVSSCAARSCILKDVAAPIILCT